MPVVIIPAASVGRTGYEGVAQLNADTDLKARLEALRRAAGPLMGLGDVSEAVIPKLCLIAPPRIGGSVSTRSFIPRACHTSIGVFAAVSVATACVIPGSVAEGIAQVDPERPNLFPSSTRPVNLPSTSSWIERAPCRLSSGQACCGRRACSLTASPFLTPITWRSGRRAWKRPRRLPHELHPNQPGDSGRGLRLSCPHLRALRPVSPRPIGTLPTSAGAGPGLGRALESLRPRTRSAHPGQRVRAGSPGIASRDRPRPQQSRGVALVEPATPDATLKHLHENGVCGARVNYVRHLNPKGFDEAACWQVVRRIEPLGWHLELHVDAVDLGRIQGFCA